MSTGGGEQLYGKLEDPKARHEFLHVAEEMFEEFHHYEPFTYLVANSVPTLVVHGDRDSAVSYEIAQQAAAAKPNTELHTVRGSDHGFDTRQREDEAVAVTVAWLIDNDGNRP